MLYVRQVIDLDGLNYTNFNYKFVCSLISITVCEPKTFIILLLNNII